MNIIQQATKKKDSKEAQVFTLIEQAAMGGCRCPTNAEIADHLNALGIWRPVGVSGIPKILQQLVRQGFVTIRIYGLNWRDVVILQGQHAGKMTLPPPHGGKPYIVIDQAERERRDKEMIKQRSRR